MGLHTDHLINDKIYQIALYRRLRILKMHEYL